MQAFLNWIKAHPRWAGWAVLAVGMNAILIYEARDVGLAAQQWAALVIATTLVAGLCVWIIGWEDEDEEEEAKGAEASKSKSGK